MQAGVVSKRCGRGHVNVAVGVAAPPSPDAPLLVTSTVGGSDVTSSVSGGDPDRLIHCSSVDAGSIATGVCTLRATSSHFSLPRRPLVPPCVLQWTDGSPSRLVSSIPARNLLAPYQRRAPAVSCSTMAVSS